MLHGAAMTVTGKTLEQNLAALRIPDEQAVVKPMRDPVFKEGGIAVLRGNLAPDGAIIKQSAASEKLMSHTGRAVVFESLEEVAARIDDPALDGIAAVVFDEFHERSLDADLGLALALDCQRGLRDDLRIMAIIPVPLALIFILAGMSEHVW